MVRGADHVWMSEDTGMDTGKETKLNFKQQALLWLIERQTKQQGQWLT